MKLTISRFCYLLFLFLSPLSISQAAEYSGVESCKSCHQEQYQQWQGSHHDLAMQEASVKTVLGNFSEKKFLKDGVLSTFFIQNERFMVNTDGPDGKLYDYEISYTFGVYPLQ
jgi:hypothetical protein